MSQKPDDPSAATERGAQRASRPWLDVVLPPDTEACEAVREILSDTRVRVNAISECISSDPVLAIELLKTANNVTNATAQTVTSLKHGVTSLGVNTISDLIAVTAARPRPGSPDLVEHLERLRLQGTDTSAIAAIVANQIAREKVDSCATTGLLSTVGEMVIVAFLKERYTELASQFTRRSQVVYRLVKDFQLDPDVVRTEYLRHQGIPKEVYGAFDADESAGSESAARTRMIVLLAIEIVDANEAGKLDIYAPGKTLPSKSQLRMMQLNAVQHAALYEQVKRYFTSGEIAVVESEDGEAAPGPQKVAVPVPVVETVPEEQQEEEDEGAGIEVILDVDAGAPVLVVAPTELESALPEVPVSKIESAVGAIADILSAAESKEELLETLLETLIEQGHFARTALLSIDRTERKAVAIASCGADSGALSRLSIDDPLSPLLQSLSKVQSCSRVGAASSPFGSPTFALAPVDAGAEGPVVLYADCGHGAKISLAARRVFRHVVERLNVLLPTLPGSIQELK